MSCGEPNWKLLKNCGDQLARMGKAPFTRRQLIDCVQRKHPEKGESSLNPMAQGMTVNLRGGAPGGIGKNVFYSIGRGLLELYDPNRHPNRPDMAQAVEAAEKPRMLRAREENVASPNPIGEGHRTRKIAGYSFRYISTIRPEHDGKGMIRTFMPQPRYKNLEGLPLHKHGSGPFCHFSIEGCPSSEGINLSSRFNVGYGRISPRNCYLKGQATNCKINHLILETAKRGDEVEVWFFLTMTRKSMESELKAALNPPWNA